MSSSMNIEVNWNVDPADVGEEDSGYDGYVITTINTNEPEKEIWSVSYSYIWNCGDGCCSNRENDVAYVGSLPEWIKKRILEKLPEYKFQGT